MCLYLSRRVVHLLRNYLRFCSAFGFIIFTYNEEKETIRTVKWRQRVSLFLGTFYFFLGFLLIMGTVVLKSGHKSAIIIMPTIVGYFNLIYMVLLQRYRASELLILINSFPSILKQVYNVTHRRIIFTKTFALRSVVRFIPMMITFLSAIALQLKCKYIPIVIVSNVIPDILVEMLHHSVYIALFVVARMYENLNMSLARNRMVKSEKFSKTYLELYRLTERLNKLLAGYFLLHFIMDIIMVSTLVVILLWKRSLSPPMLYMVASTVNKMRCLMFVTDEISERSKFYQKVGVCSIEFHFNQINFRLYFSNSIDKKMFLKLMGTLALNLVIANRYIQLVS